MPQRRDYGPGHEGTAPLRLAQQVLAGAGVLLLLPRQWVSAGIALVLSSLIHLYLRRQAKGADQGEAKAGEKAQDDAARKEAAKPGGKAEDGA